MKARARALAPILFRRRTIFFSGLRLRMKRSTSGLRQLSGSRASSTWGQTQQPAAKAEAQGRAHSLLKRRDEPGGARAAQDRARESCRSTWMMTSAASTTLQNSLKKARRDRSLSGAEGEKETQSCGLDEQNEQQQSRWRAQRGGVVTCVDAVQYGA